MLRAGLQNLGSLPTGGAEKHEIHISALISAQCLVCSTLKYVRDKTFAQGYMTPGSFCNTSSQYAAINEVRVEVLPCPVAAGPPKHWAPTKEQVPDTRSFRHCAMVPCRKESPWKPTRVY